jgi:hypothetical protein
LLECKSLEFQQHEFKLVFKASKKNKYNMQVNNVTATPYCLVQRNETMNTKGEQESSCELFEGNITAFARNV